VLEMGISVTWICMEVGSVGADGKRQRRGEISRRRGQRLRESERGCLLMAIFALSEYARDLAGI
jgi:hypothetical protein